MTNHEVKRERTCVGCGRKSSKDDLRRIVRNAEGGISFDESGRAPGRGAYACSVACFEKAYATRKLQRALRCSIGQEEAQSVAAAMPAPRTAEEG